MRCDGGWGKVTKVADCHTFAYIWPCHESGSKGGGWIGVQLSPSTSSSCSCSPCSSHLRRGRHLHLSNAFNYVKVGTFFSAFFFHHGSSTFTLFLDWLSYGRHPGASRHHTYISQQEIVRTRYIHIYMRVSLRICVEILLKFGCPKAHTI